MSLTANDFDITITDPALRLLSAGRSLYLATEVAITERETLHTAIANYELKITITDNEYLIDFVRKPLIRIASPSIFQKFEDIKNDLGRMVWDQFCIENQQLVDEKLGR
ncbi:hypothetical protein ACUN9V_09660 [Salinicola sp. V024]|uniref:hypothetical protein n=1 Tax=Salinicola sp. V024 TaxID=3459609 RepID=UPI0040445F47